MAAISSGRFLGSPVFPVPPRNASDFSFWSSRFTESISSAFGDLIARVENLNQTEALLGDFPEAIEKRVFYYDETNQIIYFDNGEWEAIGGPSVVDHISENTGHPNIVVNSSEPADSTLANNEGCFWYELI